MLITVTKSLCPVCKRVIDASVVEENGQVLIKKDCPEHGHFEDVYWSSVEEYKRFMKYQIPGDPIENPQTKRDKGCPFDCGLCNEHKTRTILANIDITNDCNLRCPICFANAAASGYLFEPTMDQIKKMFQLLRDQKPAPVDAIQLAGGEPTVRKEVFEIIKLAKDMGFHWVMMASNGIKIAESEEFTKKLKEAGLSSVYLQFDVLTPEPYIQARGKNLLDVKMRALDNLAKYKIDTCLVPTVVKGMNDDQLGDIIKFGMKHDAVRVVNFQPVSFTGRISTAELKKQRITIPDLMRLVEEQTDGAIMAKDWLPIPAIAPLERIVEVVTKRRVPKSSTHVHCGAGVYVFRKGDSFIPLNQFFDVDGAREVILEEIGILTHENFINRMKEQPRILKKLFSLIDKEKAPDYFDWTQLIKNIIFRKSKKYSAPQIVQENALFIGTMHFMDPFNFDTARVERCCIHYVTPDMRIIPFCAYNTKHREEIEKKFSKPLKKPAPEYMVKE